MSDIKTVGVKRLRATCPEGSMVLSGSVASRPWHALLFGGSGSRPPRGFIHNGEAAAMSEEGWLQGCRYRRDYLASVVDSGRPCFRR